MSRNIKTGENLDFLEATHGYSVSDIVCCVLEPDGLRDGDAVVVDGGAGLPPPLHQGGAQDEGPAEDRQQERGKSQIISRAGNFQFVGMLIRRLVMEHQKKSTDNRLICSKRTAQISYQWLQVWSMKLTN